MAAPLGGLAIGVARMAERTRPKPVIPCPKKAIWVEPDLFCKVQFLRRTRRGRLPDASFRGLIQPTG